jgi:hypothetical protein
MNGAHVLPPIVAGRPSPDQAPGQIGGQAQIRVNEVIAGSVLIQVPLHSRQLLGLSQHPHQMSPDRHRIFEICDLRQDLRRSPTGMPTAPEY